MRMAPSTPKPGSILVSSEGPADSVAEAEAEAAEVAFPLAVADGVRVEVT